MAERTQQQPLDHALQVTKETWDDTIYSSFHMFAKIVEFSNLEWKEAVKPAKFDKNTERTIVTRTESAADDESCACYGRENTDYVPAGQSL